MMTKKLFSCTLYGSDLEDVQGHSTLVAVAVQTMPLLHNCIIASIHLSSPPQSKQEAVKAVNYFPCIYYNQRLEHRQLHITNPLHL